jgi:5,10-methylene-tetrahydrofolate dehydrogenase/methenyl tetrahydrofolate cyclohydrolase
MAEIRDLELLNAVSIVKHSRDVPSLLVSLPVYQYEREDCYINTITTTGDPHIIHNINFKYLTPRKIYQSRIPSSKIEYRRYTIGKL